jgi:hypothetical protein
VFAHLFGIKPWEWERLTLEETEVLKRNADAWLKAQKDGHG